MTVTSELAVQDLDVVRELLDRLHIVGWEHLLVGDGSGSSADKECGWCCVSVSRRSRQRRVWLGAASNGTNNFAEVMAYLHPLVWFANNPPYDGAVQRVHVVTDSEYVANTGNSLSRRLRKNCGLWAGVDAATRGGLVVKWHWLRRNTCALNTFCDTLAGEFRLLIKTFLSSRDLAAVKKYPPAQSNGDLHV